MAEARCAVPISFVAVPAPYAGLLFSPTAPKASSPRNRRRASPTSSVRPRFGSLGSDAHEAGHDAPAHFHRLDVRFTKHQLMRVRTDTDQKAALSTDGTAHVTFHHEAKTAHELLFDDVWPGRQKFAHPSSGLFVVCTRG